ncbi:MAG: hypothetical protein ACRD1V_10765 [Vicinamibacterales bacterium]
MSFKLCLSLALAFMSGDTLLACPVCFGAADGPMLGAARLGVLVMAGVTCAMLAALAVFFVRIARRARCL